MCPLCKGKLLVRREPLALVCPFDRLAFPVQDGVPVMLAEEAEPLSADAVEAVRAEQ
ncbi:MAG: Trm112 family protein [Hydrogenophilus sp.]|nr:Trm112 family protein [Hydrogenophilus sp.]